MDEIGAAQKRLGRALERARAGEDRELATEIRETGERFAQLLYGALRMSRIHTEENKAFDRPVGEIVATLERLGQLLGAVHLVTVDNQVYLNDIRLRLKQVSDKAGNLGVELAAHNVGGVTFHRSLTDTEIRRLIGSFAASAPETRKREALVVRLAEREVRGIELAGIYRFRTSDDAGAPQATQGARTMGDILAHAVQLVEETWDAQSGDRVLNPLPLRRVVSEMIRRDIEDEEWWCDLPEATEHAGHAIRVCRLSLLIGRGIELRDAVMQDLGVTALLHDVAYAKEGTTLRSHSARGAALMLKQRGFHEAKVRRVLAILLHHRDYEGEDTPTLFARILRIVEDNLCAGRGEVVLSPCEALAAMCGEAGRFYDPVLLQVLINRLGRYPMGTELVLDDGRRLRVSGLVSSAEAWDRPCGEGASGETIDLATEPSVQVERVI